MALINKAKREINAKIIYYGRSGIGKSRSLRYIYDRLKPGLRGEFKTMTTMGDTLQFFDFTPFETSLFGGYRLRFHLYTLVGHVNNPAAWKMTLKGADGIVLATTASAEFLQEEQLSISSLRDYIGSYGISFHDVPIVMQLCKDVENEQILVDDFCRELGLDNVSGCLAKNETGEGVLETLSMLSKLVMARLEQEVCSSESAILPSPQANPDSSNPLPVLESPLPESKPELAVALAGEVCHTSPADGVTIPLEVLVGGESRRLLLKVSIAVG